MEKLTHTLCDTSSPAVHPLTDYKPATPGRILLVDDDPELRKLTRAFLQTEGYQVCTCSDAERALSLFHQHPNIDLLLTDLHMPGLSGLQLAERLSHVRPGLPVVVMSGAILTSEQITALHAHAWSFLSKPFPIQRLLSLIEGLLQPSPRPATHGATLAHLAG